MYQEKKQRLDSNELKKGGGDIIKHQTLSDYCKMRGMSEDEKSYFFKYILCR